MPVPVLVSHVQSGRWTGLAHAVPNGLSQGFPYCRLHAEFISITLYF